MDEGQFLQDVYPTGVALGGVGKFGFARAAHLTEASPLLTPGNIARLRQSWERYWDPDKPIRIEKTPKNLLMTRFLQAAFENSYFVVIRRHPIAVSLATQKWAGIPLHKLFEHWLRCHEIFDEDRQYLLRVHELRYEDYVEQPAKCINEIAAFIGADRGTAQPCEPKKNHNEKYFAEWDQRLSASRHPVYYQQVARIYENRFAVHGYSALRPRQKTALPPSRNDRLSHAAEVLFLLAVDSYLFARQRWRPTQIGPKRLKK